jgi:hypothetical protein
VPTELDLRLNEREQKPKSFMLWQVAGGYRAVLDGRYLHFEQLATDRLGASRWEECEAECAIRAYFAELAKNWDNAFKGTTAASTYGDLYAPGTK